MVCNAKTPSGGTVGMGVAMTSRANVVYMVINPNHEERDVLVAAIEGLG